MADFVVKDKTISDVLAGINAAGYKYMIREIGMEPYSCIICSYNTNGIADKFEIFQYY